MTEFLKRPGKPDLAYIHSPGDTDRSAIVFLGGYKSDMSGTKATHLEQFCQENSLEFLRLDYSGHGQSGGEFVDGTVGIWAGDARDVIAHILGTERSIILIGSSMGGWISMILAGNGGLNLRCLIGIAAAPDFTRDMYDHRLSPEQRATLAQEGRVELPNDYSDEPYILTKELFEDGERNFVLDGSVQLDLPICLLQGKEDKDVPWHWAETIAAHFGPDQVKITYIEDGDHSLSRPQDLKILEQTLLAEL